VTVTVEVAEATAAAFCFGSATKGELLTAAVAARASSSVLEDLLRLPDCRFCTASELSYYLGERSG
jgi:hypothetical protein